MNIKRIRYDLLVLRGSRCILTSITGENKTGINLVNLINSSLSIVFKIETAHPERRSLKYLSSRTLHTI